MLTVKNTRYKAWLLLAAIILAIAVGRPPAGTAQTKEVLAKLDILWIKHKYKKMFQMGLNQSMMVVSSNIGRKAQSHID